MDMMILFSATNVLYTNSTSTNSSDVGVAPTAEVSVA